MTFPPAFRSPWALALLPVLGGCVWLEPQEGKPVVVEPAVHCYSTLAKRDCYGDRPPEWEGRRIGSTEDKIVIVPVKDAPAK